MFFKLLPQFRAEERKETFISDAYPFNKKTIINKVDQNHAIRQQYFLPHSIITLKKQQTKLLKFAVKSLHMNSTLCW